MSHASTHVLESLLTALQLVTMDTVAALIPLKVKSAWLIDIPIHHGSSTRSTAVWLRGSFHALSCFPRAAGNQVTASQL